MPDHAPLKAGRTARRHRLAAVVVAGVALILTAGCIGDPIRGHGRIEPLAPTPFFKGGEAQPLVSGTIPQGPRAGDEAFMTGKVRGVPVTTLPVPVTPALVARGKERFDIYCAVCHGPRGEGNGIVISFGFTHPPSYYSQDLRSMPAGHYFDVMTNGFGAMYGYGDRVAPMDRWAIVAYIRSLQALRSGVPHATADSRERRP
jgi:mono/diheme cytochrome c family protein